MKKDIKNDFNPINKSNSGQDNPEKCAADSAQQTTALSACQKELQAAQEKFLRVAADLQNFQTRVAKERALWAHEAQITIFKELLPIVDDFERALGQITPEDTRLKTQLAGFELIGKSLIKLLQTFNVREIDCSGAFDPQFHEALTQVGEPTKKSGDIVAVLQKGYQLNDTVIRPAKVSVAQ